MQRARHIVIVAGEESGDHHAAELIHKLKASDPSIEISGVGGQHMQNAGAKLVSDLARYGITGLIEVIPYIRVLHRALQTIKNHLANTKPDLLILVDSPGFNLRLAKYAKKKLGLKIIYYISPQIWAWKAKRIHLIKQCVDHMAVILPFEKDIYQKAGVPVSFVGHPLVSKLEKQQDKLSNRQKLNLREDEQIIALVPGSRNNEVEKHMPVLIETAMKLSRAKPDLHFIIPIAGTICPKKIESYTKDKQIKLSLIQAQSIESMSAADFVVVASGTASLESALLEKPMCIIYKGKFISYLVAMYFIKVKFLGLCNLLVNRMMVPEFLQYDCNSTELTKYILSFYNNPLQPQAMISQLSALKESLSLNESDCSLEELIATELPEKNA
ncbi:lipid-A-disaccharide synthase [Legionella waltersii]|uniref:Lipid-A-disaccharide synthase n=1 Tax=Legionella waltersii TaxID=66969 RepID=A0A0W1ALY2_9GAMM|nr:lipid-A-disaccharide synthase [Legionella waltersii]KTD82329.1 lipid-A-disaccharide synthase [Legionella waltersii]SNV04010.1 lipid-A-disaccharide synthase [Legionella waltersii]